MAAPCIPPFPCTFSVSPFQRLAHSLLYRSSVKNNPDNTERPRRRKRGPVNAKLILAAVRLWELKRRNPGAS